MLEGTIVHVAKGQTSNEIVSFFRWENENDPYLLGPNDSPLHSIHSMYALDVVAKTLFWVLILWAFLTFTGLRTHLEGLFTESQGFLKEA